MVRLKKLSLRGFRSIRELMGFEPTPINILIGVNGAGKSNLISFFRFLSWSMSGRLQEHIASEGGASALLHDGSATTREIDAEVALETEQGRNDYAFRLAYAAGDTLIYTEEKYRFTKRDHPDYRWNELGAGHKESRLIEQAERGVPVPRAIRSLLQQCIIHQFHDTSRTARMRGKWGADDNRWLKEDAGNLAPVLLRLRDQQPEYFRRILETTRSVLPFFADFELAPDKYGQILLQWRERETDVVFSSSQASDGMLRTLALLTLLSQPESDLPGVLVLDEPELGLHPYAIGVVAGLIRSASAHSQVIVATQSTAFVNQFAPEDIVVVHRSGRESKLQRLDREQLRDWLAEYSIAELWEKNVLGGRPR